MNSIRRPARKAPIARRMSPAITEARSSPARPRREAIGASTTTKAAVGPVTWVIDPPSSATSAPATMAVYRPCCGGTPEAIARAIDRGSATTPTTSPARASRTSSRRP
jgi:hypothetical protein